MSNEMNLPWVVRIVDYDDGGGDDEYRAIYDSKDFMVDILPTHQSAHIVKCVNAHDGLVEALQSIVNGDARQTKKVEKCGHGRYGYEECESCILDFAQAALAKAQGDGK